jgi:lysophospholipid acyltransferase (LPLAT)-like uncharacterized protein
VDEIAGSGGGKAPRKRWRVRLQRRSKSWLRSRAAVGLGAGVIHGALRFIRLAQRTAPGSSDFRAILTRHHPAIVGLWHGQHLLAPFFRPIELPYVALLSRSADAEMNAAVVERFGIRTVRGSGGRVREAVREKGGARALIQLRRSLGEGFGVCMIADVPKGTPREAGLGIVTLAKLSGRPIIPSAAVTSRRHVVRRSWDRTTLPLPFGRIAVVMGDPITVPPDAGPEEMERLRAVITRAIEAANEKALALADGDRP